MVEVDGAAEESGEAVGGVRLALRSIGKRPVGVCLSFESREDERNGFIEPAQDLGFERAAGLAELELAVADVS